MSPPLLGIIRTKHSQQTLPLQEVLAHWKQGCCPNSGNWTNTHLSTFEIIWAVSKPCIWWLYVNVLALFLQISMTSWFIIQKREQLGVPIDQFLITITVITVDGGSMRIPIKTSTNGIPSYHFFGGIYPLIYPLIIGNPHWSTLNNCYFGQAKRWRKTLEKSPHGSPTPETARSSARHPATWRSRMDCLLGYPSS